MPLASFFVYIEGHLYQEAYREPSIGLLRQGSGTLDSIHVCIHGVQGISSSERPLELL